MSAVASFIQLDTCIGVPFLSEAVRNHLPKTTAVRDLVRNHALRNRGARGGGLRALEPWDGLDCRTETERHPVWTARIPAL